MLVATVKFTPNEEYILCEAVNFAYEWEKARGAAAKDLTPVNILQERLCRNYLDNDFKYRFNPLQTDIALKALRTYRDHGMESESASAKGVLAAAVNPIINKITKAYENGRYRKTPLYYEYEER